TDSDSPPQSLTFSLLQTLAYATLNSSNGVFSWRPRVSQAGSTNLIIQTVSDNGIPAMSATNSFKVIVNPVISPEISSFSFNASALNLSVSGGLGPDYTLLTSTNLVDWQPLLT